MKYLIKALFNILKGDVALRVLNRTPRILFWHGVDHRVNKNVEAEIFDIDIFENK